MIVVNQHRFPICKPQDFTGVAGTLVRDSIEPVGTHRLDAGIYECLELSLEALLLNPSLLSIASFDAEHILYHIERILMRSSRLASFLKESFGILLHLATGSPEVLKQRSLCRSRRQQPPRWLPYGQLCSCSLSPSTSLLLGQKLLALS